MQDLRTKRHVVFSLHLHLVFVTKYRKKVFTQKIYERLKYHFERVCGDFGCKLIEIGGKGIMCSSWLNPFRRPHLQGW